MMNRYAAAAVAAKITKVSSRDILAAWRKGANPQGKLLNAVIVASQLQHGTFRAATEVAVETEK